MTPDELIDTGARVIAVARCKHRQCPPIATVRDSPAGALLVFTAPGKETVAWNRLIRATGQGRQWLESDYVRQLDGDDPWTRQDTYCGRHGLRWLYAAEVRQAVDAYRRSGEPQRIGSHDTPPDAAS